MHPCTALSTSAELNTMKGAFPPNSSATLFTVEDDCSNNIFPIPVDPVNDIAIISGDLQNASPTIEAFFPEVGTTLMTPLGKPTSSDNLAIANAEYGVSLGGLMTAVQPAAKTAPSLRVIIAFGKFH